MNEGAVKKAWLRKKKDQGFIRAQGPSFMLKFNLR